MSSSSVPPSALRSPPATERGADASTGGKGAKPSTKRRGKKKGKGRKALGLTIDDDPARMCIVCRAAGTPSTLLRFARSPDGAVGFDVNNRLPGRGAWVCATAACLHKATESKHGGFARAFDAAVTFDAAVLRAEVPQMLLSQVTDRLGLLRRQGSLLLGRDEVIRRLVELAAVGLATDLSDNSRHEVRERAPDAVFLVLPTMAEVGAAVGERPVGVVGIPRRGAEALQAAIARWVGVGGMAAT
jgi:predicted RNA-binding protein YlxR (DUF448 family)